MHYSPHWLPFLRSLGVEPVDKDVLKQKPRNTKEPMITRHLIINVLLSATIIILGTLWVYNREVTLSSKTSNDIYNMRNESIRN